MIFFILLILGLIFIYLFQKRSESEIFLDVHGNSKSTCSTAIVIAAALFFVFVRETPLFSVIMFSSFNNRFVVIFSAKIVLCSVLRRLVHVITVTFIFIFFAYSDFSVVY